MRAPGMTLMRMPIFTWMSLITQVLIVLAFPAITVGLILLMFDRFFGTDFYVPAGGGDPLLWQHLFWVFGHPEVYILDSAGLRHRLGDSARSSRGSRSSATRPWCSPASPSPSSASASGRTTCSRPAWARSPTTVFAVTTMLIAIPTGVKIFNWIGTVWGGSLQFKTPMLLRARHSSPCSPSAAVGRHACLAAGRPAADRHLLRGRPLPLRAVRRQHLRPHSPASTTGSPR